MFSELANSVVEGNVNTSRGGALPVMVTVAWSNVRSRLVATTRSLFAPRAMGTVALNEFPLIVAIRLVFPLSTSRVVFASPVNVPVTVTELA